MAKVTIVLTGDKALNRKLRRLIGKDAKKAIRKAARPALKPVLEEARRRAPVKTGRLRKSIKIRALRRSRRSVGARVTTGQHLFKGDEFYGGFQELGWKTGSRRLPATERRQIEGKHFLRDAAESKRGIAISIYHRELGRQITALARRP